MTHLNYSSIYLALCKAEVAKLERKLNAALYLQNKANPVPPSRIPRPVGSKSGFSLGKGVKVRSFSESLFIKKQDEERRKSIAAIQQRQDKSEFSIISNSTFIKNRQECSPLLVI